MTVFVLQWVGHAPGVAIPWALGPLVPAGPGQWTGTDAEVFVEGTKAKDPARLLVTGTKADLVAWVQADLVARGGRPATKAILGLPDQPIAPSAAGNQQPPAQPPLAPGQQQPAPPAPPVQPPAPPVALVTDTRQFCLVNVMGGGLASGVPLGHLRLVLQGTPLPPGARVHAVGDKISLYRWVQADVANRGGQALAHALLLLERTPMLTAATVMTLFITRQPQQQRAGRGQQRQPANSGVDAFRLAEGDLPDTGGLTRQVAGTRVEIIAWIFAHPAARGGQELVQALDAVHEILAAMPAPQVTQVTPQPAAPAPQVTQVTPQPAAPAPSAWIPTPPPGGWPSPPPLVTPPAPPCPDPPENNGILGMGTQVVAIMGFLGLLPVICWFTGALWAALTWTSITDPNQLERASRLSHWALAGVMGGLLSCVLATLASRSWYREHSWRTVQVLLAGILIFGALALWMYNLP